MDLFSDCARAGRPGQTLRPWTKIRWNVTSLGTSDVTSVFVVHSTVRSMP